MLEEKSAQSLTRSLSENRREGDTCSSLYKVSMSVMVKQETVQRSTKGHSCSTRALSQRSSYTRVAPGQYLGGEDYRSGLNMNPNILNKVFRNVKKSYTLLDSFQGCQVWWF